MTRRSVIMLRIFFLRLVFHVLRLALHVLRLALRVLRLVFHVLRLNAEFEGPCNRGKRHSYDVARNELQSTETKKGSRGSTFTSLGERDSCCGTTPVISGSATRERGIIFSFRGAGAAVR